MAELLLERNKGKRLRILLSYKEMLKGILRTFDVNMNLVLDEAELKSPEGTRILKTVLVRGNNIVAILFQDRIDQVRSVIGKNCRYPASM